MAGCVAVTGGLNVQDCTPGGGCDGDVFVSTAPFALPAFSETRFAAAGLRFDDSRVAVTGPGTIATDGSVTVAWTSADAAARVRLDAGGASATQRFVVVR